MKDHPEEWTKNKALRKSHFLGTGKSRTPRRTRNKRRYCLERQDYKCAYCGCGLTLIDSTLDHVIPLSEGGRTYIDNLVSACGPCNIAKGSMPVKEFMKERRS